MTDQELKRLTLKVDLPTKDIKQLFKKAAEVGLSVDELLQNFIYDLTGSDNSNGSDERDFANQWFDRCWFAQNPEDTFLRYLLRWDQLDYVVELNEDLQNNKKALESFLTNEVSAEDTEEERQIEINDYKEQIDDLQSQLDDIFTEYKKWVGSGETLFLDDESYLCSVVEWKESLDKITMQN